MPDVLGLLGGLTRGFNKASTANRAELRRQEDLQADRESKILTSLVSSDDPDISAAAVSAMAEIAGGAPRPKGGFLQRIVGGGRAAVHPSIAPILDLLHTPGKLDVDLGRARGGATPAQTPATPGGAGGAAGGPPVVAPPGSASVPATPMSEGGPPSVSALGSPGAPPRGQPAGLVAAPDGSPEMSPTREVAPSSPVNAPPMQERATRATSVPQITQAPGMPERGAFAAQGGGPPSVLPLMGQSTPGFNRTVFLPAEEVQRRQMQRHAEGIELDLQSKVNAVVKVGTAQGWSPEEIKKAVKQTLGLGGSALREGNIVPDKNSPTGYSQQLYDPNTGQVEALIPGQQPPSARSYRSMAWPQGDPNGRPAWVQVLPDGSLKFIGYQGTRDATATVTHADGSQELVLVPARFSAGTEGAGTPGGPPPVGAGGDVPQTPGAPPSKPQVVLTTKDAIPINVQAHQKRTFDGDFFVNPPTSGMDTIERRRLTEEATKLGLPVVDDAEAVILDDVSVTLQNMDAIDHALDGKLPKDAFGKFLGQGLSNRLQAYLQTDAELAAFSTWRSAAIRALRGMAGSKSFRMTQAEIDLSIANDIPQITDTVDTALRKTNTVRMLLRHTTDHVLSRGIPPDAYTIKPGFKRDIGGIWWGMPAQGGRPRNMGQVKPPVQKAP